MTLDYSELLSHVTNLAIALALGFLIGSERGWRGRTISEGGRAAGIRTFSILGLFGGLVGAGTSGLGGFHAWLLCALVFAPVALLLIVAYWRTSRNENDLGITTEVAAMLTYWLGVLPAMGLALPAAASAVVLALLLHIKELLHHWLQVLDRTELLGTLQFLLVSVVLLPLLPNEGFGPWQAINPYQLWWMVVLISGLSLIGYFASRVAGTRNGILATSLTGGLVSSTAVTLSLSRMYRELGQRALISAGILLACATMFGRVLVVVAVIHLPLVPLLLLPMLAGIATLLLAAYWLWRQAPSTEAERVPTVQNPFELLPALQFGFLLALVMLAAEGLSTWFGDTGLYLLSVFSGLADVDAIVLSLSPKAGESITNQVVVMCIALAAATNTLMKGIYCRIIGGADLGWRVLKPVLLSSILVMASAGVILVGYVN